MDVDDDDDDDVVTVEGGLVFMSKLFVLQVFNLCSVSLFPKHMRLWARCSHHCSQHGGVSSWHSYPI